MALVATAVGLMQRFAAEETNKKALAAVLEKNVELKAQINSSKPASQQTDAMANALKGTGRAKGPRGISETHAYQQEKRKALEEHILNDREFGLKYYAALRSDVDRHYGPFYRLQHLTKEQTGALAEALFQRRLRHDKAASDNQAGGSVDDVRIAKADADAELAAAVQEMLGADLYEKFSLYERQRPAWDYVGNFGGMLSLADMPLSLAQASLLAGAIANANTLFQNGDTVRMAATGTDQDWDAVYDAAMGFLTPEQLNFFKNTSIPPGNDNVTPPQEMEMNNALKKSGFKGTLRSN
ncbi:hypothetical protein CKA38_08220 [Ereboglobus luteus]|uniref:Uncharacterized protein n=2 Tax=Ereboglobus luteus TaxID=1796921 RepID=A0A2U8E360_9BACT|nr:hypothetical protein CKA38_08220 [Ereboglobus luteus]